MNMLPHGHLSAHDHPDGIRIGIQGMTRFGMGREEVNRFRPQYQEVKYSFNEPARMKPGLVKMKTT
jgi:glycine/serine hydroxymethyltransferase